MGAEWTNNLSIDMPKIDSQHQELFRQIDILLKAWSGGRGRVEVVGIIKFLERYIADHFAVEERYMIKYAYANRLAHMAQHEVFRTNFEKLKTRYYQTGADDDLIADMNELVVDWFRDHIRFVDRALGLYLKIMMHEGRVA